jgi:hypothetical protein
MSLSSPCSLSFTVAALALVIDTTCLFLSCLALPCLVLPCRVLFCLVLSCLALSYLVLPCLALPCLALSCLVLSCLVCTTQVVEYEKTGKPLSKIAPNSQTSNGILMLLDVSGFTKLSDTLCSVGVLGGEKLLSLLNSFFEGPPPPNPNPNP